SNFSWVVVIYHSQKGPTKVGTLNTVRLCIMCAVTIPSSKTLRDYIRSRRTEMRQRTLKVERLGRVEYGAALEIQKQTERAVLTGAQADTLLLLEHPHTLTLGRRGAQNGIMALQMVLRTVRLTAFAPEC